MWRLVSASRRLTLACRSFFYRSLLLSILGGDLAQNRWCSALQCVRASPMIRKSSRKSTRTLLIACAGLSLAAAVIFAAPQSVRSADSSQGAHFNDLGTAYMNQQLFEKGLKAFEDAAKADPGLKIARVNQGVAL